MIEKKMCYYINTNKVNNVFFYVTICFCNNMMKTYRCFSVLIYSCLNNRLEIQ